MKRILSFGICLTAAISFAQTDISDARTNYNPGQTVTIRGVAANGGELGPIRYIQDESGGLPAYGTILNGVNLGDSIEVTGQLLDFNGLLEISPTNTLNTFGTGLTPVATNLGILDFSNTTEGRLVQIDNVTFTASGSFAGNTNYEFTDGTNVSEIRINSGTNLVGTTIPSGPVTIVGLLSEFNAFQVLPRATTDIYAYTPPDKEIVVEIEGNNFLTGQTYIVGTNVTTNIDIKNVGINDLTLLTATFTGANAADFSTSITLGTVSGGGTNSYTITFTPSGNGTHTAQLTIGNDDADENPFIIDLYAVGNDGLATEPSSLPTNLQFSNIKAYGLDGSYVPSLDAENYLVVWKTGSAPTGAPVDGTQYLRGDVVGDGQVAYVGAATNFAPRGIRANIDYYFTVYPFSGTQNFTNYNTSTPLSGMVSSTGEEIGNYYQGIDVNSPTFVSDLTSLINPHTYISYFLYKTTLLSDYELRDTTNGDSFIECVYTGERKVFSGSFDWTATGYSREHTMPHSWMKTWPADNPEEEEYADQHNLYPTNLAEANSPRSNVPLGEVTGAVLDTYLDGTLGRDDNNELVYEPKDSHKGNAARSILYMITAYNGISGSWGLDDLTSSQANYQDIELLKQWHFNDAPDSYEIGRHEYIADLQGNRNPYIDSMDFACYVDFSNMTHQSAGCLAGIEDLDLVYNLVVYPNPSNQEVYVQVNGQQIESYEVVDMTGRVVYTQSNIVNPVIIDRGVLNAGTYIINVKTANGRASNKLVIQ